LSRLREEGAKGLVHGLRGRRSNRRLPEGVRERAFEVDPVFWTRG